jgi:hypothetical protein
MDNIVIIKQPEVLMPGVKGQKWNKERPKPKSCINASLDDDIFEKVTKIAVTKKWSKSQTVAELVIIGLRHSNEL